MNNVSFHKTDMVRNAVAAAGHHLLYLPPYSPHLNPVESVFSSVRNHVWQEVVQEEEEEDSKQVSDEEGYSQDGEMGAMLAPAPLHVKVERKYSGMSTSCSRKKS
ncbi:hypothetical protein K457DRAFT_1824051 [Linnemannia elongata AG-77]|uniref:Tc1-like transposase DDE domain-containing protein n=1 Tax=Linnemannia elongata AG-77 TaxID=1314771 RepID=A0A197JGM7_9FUNG|nr:hypothetical protein K457DRAFT_1824051 [Linnemannia elongata AG-77]